MLFSTLTITAFLISFSNAAQLPFGFNGENVNNKLSSESSSSFIKSDTFTTLTHPDFDSHSVRIKETTGWCDSVKSYSGYIDSGSRHLFFYFFEARTSPETSPLLMWINGGPGCSSSMGLLMELGPCSISKDGNSTVRNPYSWTETSNMIFLDSPIGVGYSYSSDSGVFVGTTEEAAVDVHAFLTIFIETFSEFKHRDLHLSGESYGGRYLPVFASEILYQNSLLASSKSKSKHSPINLKSVLIGNGLTDAVGMTTSYYDQACTKGNGVGKPVLDIKTCLAMQQEVNRCDKWLTKVCRDNLVQPECDIASNYCGEQFTLPFIYGGINPYDISKPCTTLAEDLCYPETSVIKTLLDQPWLRNILGVDDSVGPFESCSGTVGNAFAITRDGLAPTFFHLTALLENKIDVLIYVGTYDWICNWIGNLKLVNDLAWSGKEGFAEVKLEDWKLPSETDEARSGQSKSFGGLTYMTVERAGHMVPLDRPKEALHMVKNWLEGKKL